MSQKPSRAARERDGGKSFDGFSLPPHNIVIIGVDTEHGPEHALYSQRAVDIAAGRRDYDMRFLRSLHTFGVKQPISVRLEQVPADDEAWPERFRGELVHVVVTGRHRVLYGRRVAEEKEASGEIGDRSRWQIRCSLEHAKKDTDLIAIVADENVCRRVLDDEEIAEGILRGVNASITIEEMAERFGITVSKAKRLKARAEGVPEKPRRPAAERISAAALGRATRRLRTEQPAWDAADVADLMDAMRGKKFIQSCSPRVQDLILTAGDE